MSVISFIIHSLNKHTLAAETLAAVDGDYILEISHMDYVVKLLENIGIKENLKCY